MEGQSRPVSFGEEKKICLLPAMNSQLLAFFALDISRRFFLIFLDVTGIGKIGVLGVYSFIHLVVCLTTGPKPLPKRALHIVTIQSFLLKMRVSSPFLKVIQ